MVVIEKKSRKGVTMARSQGNESYKEGKLLMEENIKLGFYHAKGKMIESPTAYPVEVACGRFC